MKMMMPLMTMTIPRTVVIVTLTAANHHNTQLNEIVTPKIVPQLIQVMPRINNKKKFIQMRKLTQMRRKNQRKFHKHNDLG